MVHDSVAAHHHQKRHGKINTKFWDNALYFSQFFGLIMTIPQITKIWIGKNAAGVSVISWTSYLVLGLVMIGYGSAHKERPIIITYTCWIAAYLMIITGTLLYG